MISIRLRWPWRRKRAVAQSLVADIDSIIPQELIDFLRVWINEPLRGIDYVDCPIEKMRRRTIHITRWQSLPPRYQVALLDFSWLDDMMSERFDDA